MFILYKTNETKKRTATTVYSTLSIITTSFFATLFGSMTGMAVISPISITKSCSEENSKTMIFLKIVTAIAIYLKWRKP